MKKFVSKRRLLALAACTIFFGTFSFPAAATNKKIQEACNGVVRVYCQVSNDEASTGSGFAVGKAGQPASLFVTNYHVIADNPEQVCLVLDSLADQKTIIPAKVVAGSADTDIAILQTAQPIRSRTPLPLESTKELEVTQQVYALGFPGAADKGTDQGDQLPSTPNDVTVTSGTVTKKQTAIGNMNFVQIDATINHGNSGGPLMTEDGYVVGINARGALNDDKTQAAGTNYSIFIDYVMDFLDKSNIPYDRGEAGGGEQAPSGSQEPAPAASSPKAAVSTPQTPAPAASSAQAPAGPASAQPQAPAQPASAPESSKGSSGGVSYLTIAAVAAVIGLIIAYFRRKKKPGAPAAAPAVPAPIAPQPFPAVPAAPSSRKIVGAGGIFSGTSFPVSGPVLLGRDPHRCSIVYPADAPGISSAHCEVRVSGSGLILTDLGSSYGTFLADGRKLTAHQPVELAPGSSFYLASQENSFQVE